MCRDMKFGMSIGYECTCKLCTKSKYTEHFSGLKILFNKRGWLITDLPTKPLYDPIKPGIVTSHTNQAGT
jgi:hypothetical protein